MALRFNADEIYAIGVQIEKNGSAFYEKAAQKSADSDLRDLFSRLSEWEKRHIALFESLRLALPSSVRESDVFDPENTVHLYLKAVADNTIFIKGLNLDTQNLVWTSPSDILLTALDFEKDSVLFFSSMKELATEPKGAAQVDKIIAEELRHVGFLSGEIRKLG